MELFVCLLAYLDSVVPTPLAKIIAVGYQECNSFTQGSTKECLSSANYRFGHCIKKSKSAS